MRVKLEVATRRTDPVQFLQGMFEELLVSVSQHYARLRIATLRNFNGDKVCDSNDGVSVTRERDTPIAFGCLLVGLLRGNFETLRGAF